MISRPVVYIVDDEQAVREALRVTVELMDLEPRCHGLASQFLQDYDKDRIGCLIVDLRMPEMSGLELLDAMTQRGIKLPSIMITGHGDVPAAVLAMKLGAIDFLEKPYRPEVLRDCIQKAVNVDRETRHAENQRLTLKQRMNSLTPSERDILDLTVAGKPDKAIASRLGLSPRTIQLRRASLMKKLHAKSRIELAQLTQQANDEVGLADTAGYSKSSLRQALD